MVISSPTDDLGRNSILDNIDQRPRTPPLTSYDRPLFGNLQKAYTAEAPTNMEWGMLGGLPFQVGPNFALNSLLLPSHTLVPTLLNPYDSLNGFDMLGQGMLPQAPVQLPETLQEDEAAPTRRRRRKKRKPKRDRKVCNYYYYYFVSSEVPFKTTTNRTILSTGLPVLNLKSV